MDIINNINRTIEAANNKIDAYAKKHLITTRKLFIRAGMNEGDYNNYVCFRKGTKKKYSLEKLQKVLDYINNNKISCLNI
jgi:hypothetical protein